MSIVADMDLSQNQDSPLQDELGGTGYNYDDGEMVYKYSKTENVLYPEAFIELHRLS